MDIHNAKLKKRVSKEQLSHSESKFMSCKLLYSFCPVIHIFVHWVRGLLKFFTKKYYWHKINMTS